MRPGGAGSLKTRFELVLASTTAVLLLLMAALLVFVRYRDQRRLLEDNARMFAATSNDTLCEQFQIYYHSGSYKFRELVRRTMSLNPDVQRILILSVVGDVLYDSSESAAYGLEPHRGRRVLADAPITDAAAGLTPSVFLRRDPRAGPLLMIVSPYIEEWGRHRYSILYVFSYASLSRTMRALVLPIASVLLLSVLVTTVIARYLAGRVAGPIERLTRGVREFDAGHGATALRIETADEIQELAETFNRMSARIEQQMQQLQGANEELKTLDRMKTDLLANVSHELRTPLSAIRGYVEILSDRSLGSINDSQARALAVCMRNLDRLNRNINMLLDFSRMELGHVALRPVAFRADQLAHQVASAFENDARKKGVRLSARSSGDIPPVVADRDKITQVLENLVGNALKFTPAGKAIELRVHHDAPGRRVAVEVADEGIGISPEQRSQIFDKFYQVDGTAARRFGGVGLGLAIVKSILDAHQVEIAVEDRPGGGTLFRFALPVAEGRISQNEVPIAPPPGGGDATILAIDDDPAFLDFLETSLGREGRRILRAASAAEGLRLAKERQPALILLDVALPDESGFEVLRRLKAEAATRDIPTLVITVINDQAEGIRLGAEDYLVKPVDRTALFEIVERILAAHPSDHAPLILVVDDEADIRSALSEMLAARGYRVATAASGAEGLAAVRTLRPALVLLDVMMPEMTGWEVLREIRQTPYPETPVIILSARESAATQTEGARLGAAAFLGKSEGYGHLLRQIRAAIGSSLARGAA